MTNNPSTPSGAENISDDFGNTWSAYCPNCGNKSMSVVRPGKVQCDLACDVYCVECGKELDADSGKCLACKPTAETMWKVRQWIQHSSTIETPTHYEKELMEISQLCESLYKENKRYREALLSLEPQECECGARKGQLHSNSCVFMILTLQPL